MLERYATRLNAVEINSSFYPAYTPEALRGLARQIQTFDGHVWGTFDNTAAGEAVGNALDLLDLIRSPGG